MTVALVRTGVANVASVAAAFRRLGVDLEPTEDPAVVAEAPAVVLPGVGSFGAGVARLGELGVGSALAERIERGAPTLAVCLGLQLLARTSEESPAVRGLDVLPTEVVRLRGAPRLPHFGWNRVEPADGSELLVDGDAYFAHTFHLADAEALTRDGWRVAHTAEGARFVSAVERGAVLACQFHPELSGAWGAALLGRWLAAAGVERTQEVA
ncbi:MAG: imidazole glycerol phosphate synthase subunit HisH [Planctomycetota bacterium]